MSVPEQITDALDDENPPQSIAEVVLSLLGNGDCDGFDTAFKEIKRNAKQPIVANEAINESFKKISAFTDDENKLLFMKPIVNYLLSFPLILKEMGKVADAYLALCQKTQNFREVARFYKEQGIDENAEEPVQLDYYLKIGELYLKSNVVDQANGMLNKANMHRFPLTSPKPLLDRYESLKAEIQVVNQNYDFAADLLHTMSSSLSDPNAKKTALKRSLIFAIVSPPGPKRDNVFSKLSSDEEAQVLPIFAMFDRLNKRQIITGDEIEKLWDEVKSEQSIKKEDLVTNIRFHNLTQIAYLYSVISLSRMAQIVGVSESEALLNVEQMIQNGRLKAKIDQPHQMVIYTRDSSRSKEVSIKDFSDTIDEVTMAIEHL